MYIIEEEPVQVQLVRGRPHNAPMCIEESHPRPDARPELFQGLARDVREEVDDFEREEGALGEVLRVGVAEHGIELARAGNFCGVEIRAADREEEDGLGRFWGACDAHHDLLDVVGGAVRGS